MIKTIRPTALFLLLFAFISFVSRPVASSEVLSSEVSIIKPTNGVPETAELNDLDVEVYKKAMTGFKNLRAKGATKNILAIVDFSKPSTSKRLYIFDAVSGKLLYNTFVAHGRNSGENVATHFSNQPNSYQSSLGFYITSSTYVGKHGESLILNGQEKGINDNALSRAIVLHAADYVSEEFIRQNKRLGRSQGCPSVSQSDLKPVIGLLKDGACLFIYAPNAQYSSYSALLN
jgi:hypothetical protein